MPAFVFISHNASPYAFLTLAAPRLAANFDLRSTFLRYGAGTVGITALGAGRRNTAPGLALAVLVRRAVGVFL